VAQRITLTDIAEQAGVSTATVSRVLNGKSNVADETRRQVLAALDVLGYERPESVDNRSRGLVGLIVPELSNPIFPLFAQEIEQLLTPSGHTPVLCTQTPGGVSEDEYIEMLVERGVSGIVFVSGRHADTTGNVTRYQKLRSRGVPLVTINGNAPMIKAPGFTTDDRAAARMAVEHLANLGHRRIGFATGPTRMVPAVRKRAGYEDAMRACCPGEDLRIVESLYTYEGGATAGAALAEQGCTGIICGSDLMALGAIKGIQSTGRAVPTDISVIGYDDSPLLAMTHPPLTTVRQPVEAICRAAISTLLAAINGEKPVDAEMTFIPDLIVRGSTAMAPGIAALRGSAATPPGPQRDQVRARRSPMASRRWTMPAAPPSDHWPPGAPGSVSAYWETMPAPASSPLGTADSPATRIAGRARRDAAVPTTSGTESARMS